jgi:hypothetical protein
MYHNILKRWNDLYNLPPNSPTLSGKPPNNEIKKNHYNSYIYTFTNFLKPTSQSKLDCQGFEFSESSLSKEAMEKCHDLVNPDSPPKKGYFQTERDISSFMFAQRYKRIRYLCVSGKTFTCLPRSLNYFIQHQTIQQFLWGL